MIIHEQDLDLDDADAEVTRVQKDNLILNPSIDRIQIDKFCKLEKSDNCDVLMILAGYENEEPIY